MLLSQLQDQVMKVYVVILSWAIGVTYAMRPHQLEESTAVRTSAVSQMMIF